MSTVIDQNMRTTAPAISSMVSNTAANDDHIPTVDRPRDASESGGWDAHDVWRRLIKDARDRRTTTATRLPQ